MGEKEESKIIRPIQNFRGKFRAKNNDIDYFPERWIVFNSKYEKIELKYWFLITKGAFFKIVEKMKHHQKSSIKKIKKFIKKIIRRE